MYYIHDDTDLEKHDLPARDDPCWRNIYVDLGLRPWFRHTWVVQEAASPGRSIYSWAGQDVVFYPLKSSTTLFDFYRRVSWAIL
jgi:hypothetical protein